MDGEIKVESGSIKARIVARYLWRLPLVPALLGSGWWQVVMAWGVMGLMACYCLGGPVERFGMPWAFLLPGDGFAVDWRRWEGLCGLAVAMRCAVCGVALDGSARIHAPKWISALGGPWGALLAQDLWMARKAVAAARAAAPRGATMPGQAMAALGIAMACLAVFDAAMAALGAAVCLYEAGWGLAHACSAMGPAQWRAVLPSWTFLACAWTRSGWWLLCAKGCVEAGRRALAGLSGWARAMPGAARGGRSVRSAIFQAMAREAARDGSLARMEREALGRASAKGSAAKESKRL